MADLVRAFNWAQTSLGPSRLWPQSLKTSTELVLLSNVPMVILWGEDGVMIYNDAYAVFAAGRHPQLLGSKVREGWPEVADFNDNVMKVGLAGRTLAYKDQELTLHRKGRPEQVWMNLDYSPVPDESGRPAGVLAVVIETTDRVAAEAAMRESEERFRNMADHAPVMLWLTDPDGRCLYLNRAWYAFTGQSPAEAQGFGWLDATHPADKPEAERVFLEANVKREPFRLEYKLKRNDGVYRWAIDAASPRFGPRGEFLGYIGSVIDIDERREAENALRMSELRYRTLFEAIDAGFCVLEVDLKGACGRVDYRVVEANPAFFRKTGFPQEIAGRWLREAAPDLEDHWYEVYGEVARTGEAVRFEQESQALGRWFDVHAFRMSGVDGGRVAVLFNDITSRRQSEDRIRQLNDTLEQRITEALAEREFLATIVETTDAQVQAIGMDYRLLAINSSSVAECERIYGKRPFVGQNILDVLAAYPEQQAVAKAAWGRALAGEAFTKVGEFGDSDREKRVYEMKFEILHDLDGKQTGAFLMGRDVTERVREQARLRDAEEQLRQSQKMESMGQLTGGVAHDFNNLLTPIIGSLDMLQRRGVGTERERRLIGGALQSAERAKVLVQRLLAFARRQPLQSKSVEIGSLVEGMATLIVSTLGPTIDVRVELEPDLPPALADPNQVEMALLNLAVNARDAMPNGGELTIAARRDDVVASRQHDMKPGVYVRLSVIDTGAGMDEATLNRAVEPFFSTKGVGQGTGLGLSMVHGLAAQLGGGMKIESSRGLGTKVDLWLPVSPDRAEEKAHGSSHSGAGLARGEALLVDDDDLVRMSTADMLTDLGFDVVEARSAEEALELMANGATPDVLVTDHIMPGMTGADLAKEARKLKPGLPVLVVSAYAEVDGIAPDLPRLTKPFRNAELAESLAALTRKFRGAGTS